MMDIKAINYALRHAAPDHGLSLIQDVQRTDAGGETGGLFYFVEGNGKRYKEWLPESLVSASAATVVDVVAMSLAGVAARSGVRPMTGFTGPSGTWRCYFNRHQAAPLVWCCALVNPRSGLTHPPLVLEIAVADVRIEAPCRTVYAPKPTPDHEDGKPSAWIEVDGVLTIAGGVATIAQAT